MKAFVIALFCFGAVTSARAANPFRCTGNDNSGDRVLTLAVSGQSITQLRNVRLNWSSSYPVRLTLPIVQRSDSYKPRSPKFRGLEKWIVDVANGPACKWDLLLPPAASRTEKFTAFSQTACDSYYETIVLSCANS